MGHWLNDEEKVLTGEAMVTAMAVGVARHEEEQRRGVSEKQRWLGGGNHGQQNGGSGEAEDAGKAAAATVQRSARAVGRTEALTWGPHAVSPFSNLFQIAQTYKIKMDALYCSNISQFLYEAILEYSKQLY
jgi:hypothetical protein